MALFCEELEKQQGLARERSVALFYEELERKRCQASQERRRYSAKSQRRSGGQGALRCV